MTHRATRKDARMALQDLLASHFRAQNETKTPDERSEARLAFTYQREELERILADLAEQIEDNQPMRRKPDKLYQRTFAVRGSGPFPFDMLRYDHAWPADEQASIIIDADSISSKRVVRLRMATPTDHGPTARRWLSFGWTVCESLTSHFETTEEDDQ